MSDARRHQLLGSYRTPAFRYGGAVTCAVRGEVIVTGLTHARIPWPLARRPGGRARARVVYAGLAAAVRRESASAVAHWWGVTAQTVGKWRRLLGVPPLTEGTTRLKAASARASPKLAAARQRAMLTARDPERRRRIGDSKRGKPRPRHVVEAMSQARTGRPHSELARQKMSEAHRRRGSWPPAAGRPWTADEQALLGTMPDEAVASRIGRPVSAVRHRRARLRIRLSPGGRNGDAPATQ